MRKLRGTSARKVAGIAMSARETAGFPAVEVRQAACSRRCRTGRRKGPRTGEHDVPNLEERVTSLEAQADKHAAAVDGLRTEMAGLRTDLRGEMDALRVELRSDMAALRTELLGDMAGLRTDLGELSRRTDRFVIWLAGTQAATLLAVIGVLVTALFR
jgi:hypothetical protein